MYVYWFVTSSHEVESGVHSFIKYKVEVIVGVSDVSNVNIDLRIWTNKICLRFYFDSMLDVRLPSHLYIYTITFVTVRFASTSNLVSKHQNVS